MAYLKTGAEKPLKIIFVLRSMHLFPYVESILRSLLNAGHTVVFTYDSNYFNQQWESLPKLQQAFPNFEMLPFERREDENRKWLFAMREIHTYASYLARKGQSVYYTERWKKYLPIWFLKNTRYRCFNALLASSPVRSFMEWLDGKTPPAQNLLDLLKKTQPDILVATPVNMRFSEEVEYIKAAKSLGIPTAVPVLSWDNLSTKGLFHSQPDWCLAWNWSHQQDASAYHHYLPERVVLTGSPFFDKWFDDINSLLKPREDFCRQVGLNPEYPYLAYLGSSKNIARDETWLVRGIIEELRQQDDPRLKNMGVLLRPHPANFENYLALEDEQVVMWPKSGVLPDDTDAKQDFVNSVSHSELTVGINTSGMIDALILDKPCATILTEEYTKTQMEAVHFQHLMKSDTLYTSQSAVELVAQIRDILQQGDRKEAERKAFLESFIRPYGLEHSGGEVAAHAIVAIAHGNSPQKVLAERATMTFNEISGKIPTI